MLQTSWKVIEFFPYERFKEVHKYCIVLNMGDAEKQMREQLVENARDNGVKAGVDNKIAFLLKHEDGREMVVAFYDLKMYIIPISVAD